MRRRIVEITIGNFTLPINSYGLMMAVGFLLAIHLASRRAEREGLDPEVMIDMGWLAIIAGILGARALFVLQNFRSFARRPVDMLRVDQGGLVFYGGFLAATAVVSVYLRRKKVSIAQVLDILTPSLALGLAFTRIGCFLNGCCWGDVCRHPHIVPAVQFPGGPRGMRSFAFNQHLNLGLIGPDALTSLPVHPTQLYSSCAAFLLFVLTAYLYRYRRHKGEVLAAFTVLYSITRFTLEFWRGDNAPVKWLHFFQRTDSTVPPPFWEGFTISQCIAVVTFFAALGWIVWVRTRSSRPVSQGADAD